MGIRRKIGLGFAAISCLLLFAGIFSYMEIINLKSISNTVVSMGARSVVMSNSMLSIISHQDSAVVNFIMENDTTSFIKNSKETLQKLELITNEAKQSFPNNKDLNELLEKYSDFIDILTHNSDSSKYDIKWYLTVYKEGYNEFVNTVKNFMYSAQQDVIEETDKLTQNAYRAIRQGLVTLIAAIVIIIMFYLLMDIYYVNPVIQITKALKNYHNLKTPFNVSIVGRDEVYMLKEYISQLMLKIESKNRKDPF